ncbi:MAG: hypothetical protein ACRCWM_08035 [Sarcina sp.]|uniref:hypothetical protein n=1 Tax=Clostridium chrysemydis TaxID=2665504 RepID=UPI003F2B173C
MFRVEELNDLQKICFNSYFGKVEKYSKEETDEIITNMFREAMPPMPERKADFKNYFEDNGKTLYRLLEQTITPVMNRLSLEGFSDLVKVDTCDLGDAPVYTVKNTKLYPVSQKATGVGATRRSRMHDGKLETSSFPLTAFVYEEAFEILTGRVTWGEICAKVIQSFEHKIATLITSTIFDAYDGTNNSYCKVADSNSIEATLDDLIEKIEGDAGSDCLILGTKGALAKIPNSGGVYNGKDSDDRRDFGYVKVYDGTQCVKLPQYYDKETDNFEIPRDTLIIIPYGEILAHCTYEGDLVTLNKDAIYNRNDRQVEFSLERICRIGVPISAKFGMIKIS